MILSYIIYIVAALAIQLIVSNVVYYFYPNQYLASIISSIVISFFYAFMINRNKKEFFKDASFWTNFFITGILFLGIDLVTFLF